MIRVAAIVAAALCVGGTAAGCNAAGSAGLSSQTGAASTASPVSVVLPTVSATGGGSSGSGGNGSGGAQSTGAASSSQPVSAHTVIPADPGTCGNGQLTVGEQDAGAASGHSGLLLTFKNNGSSPCSVLGYPGASLQLPQNTPYNAQRSLQGYLGGDQSPQQTAPLVTIQPGTTVSALLEWVDFPQNGSSTVTAADCAGYGSTALLVTVPNTTASITLTAPTDVCWDFSVHPVVPVVANTWQ
jgi:Protein of unknown function (DUF4232)